MLHTRIAHVHAQHGAVVFRDLGRRPLRFPFLRPDKTDSQYYSYSTGTEPTAAAPFSQKNNSAGRATVNVSSTVIQQPWLQMNKQLRESAGNNAVSQLESPDALSEPLGRLSPAPVPGPWDLLNFQTPRSHVREITLPSYLSGTTANAKYRARQELFLMALEETGAWPAIKEERLLEQWSTLSHKLKRRLWPLFIFHQLDTDPEELYKVLSKTWIPQYGKEGPLRSLIRYLYYHALSKKLSLWTTAQQGLAAAQMDQFYELLIDLLYRVTYPKLLLKQLPSYNLIQNCPPDLREELQTLLETGLSESHWEDHLRSACTHAEQGDTEGAVRAIEDAVILHADTSSIEFYNAVSTVLQPSNPYDDATASTPRIIWMLLQALEDPKLLHPLIYTRLCEQALTVGDIRTIYTILQFQLNHGVDLFPRTVICVLRGMQECDDEMYFSSIIRVAKEAALKWESEIVANHAIFCLLVYHSRRGSNSVYADILPHYLELYSPQALAQLGLPHSMPDVEQGDGPKMQPTNLTLTMMAHAYLTDNRCNPNAISTAYDSFRQAVNTRSASILQALKAGPSLYNIFLLAFSRLPETQHLQDCMTVMTDVSTELPAATLPIDPDTSAPIVLAGPDLHTWRLLLRALGHFRQFAAAEKVLVEIRRRWGTKDAVGAAHSLMSAYASAQNVQGALKIFRHLTEDDLKAPELTLKALGRLKNRNEWVKAWMDEVPADEDSSVNGEKSSTLEARSPEDKEEAV